MQPPSEQPAINTGSPLKPAELHVDRDLNKKRDDQGHENGNGGAVMARSGVSHRGSPGKLQHIIHVVIKTLNVALQALREAAALLVDATDREALLIQLLHPGIPVLGRRPWLLHANIIPSQLPADDQHLYGSQKDFNTDIRGDMKYRYIEELMHQVGAMTMHKQHHRPCCFLCLHMKSTTNCQARVQESRGAWVTPQK